METRSDPRYLTFFEERADVPELKIGVTQAMQHCLMKLALAWWGWCKPAMALQ
jgi:hypothetical protein